MHGKGYPRVKAGPLRDQLVHRIVAAALLRRPLLPDEQIHHMDLDKTNFHWSNLLILSGADHAWLSNRYLLWERVGDYGTKQEIDMFVQEKAAEQWKRLGIVLREPGADDEALNGQQEQNEVRAGTAQPSTAFP